VAILARLRGFNGGLRFQRLSLRRASQRSALRKKLSSLRLRLADFGGIKALTYCEALVKLLGKMSRFCGVEVLTYCVMPNQLPASRAVR